MADDYSSSRSDEEIMEAQKGSRKRRKLSVQPESDSDEAAPAPSLPTVTTLSRVKPGKLRESIQPSQSVAEPVVPVVKNASFATIDVAPWLVASLSSMEIKRPTGIQKACIPEILKGRDCIGGSRTGTGKTIAFSVPIMQKWAEDPCGIFALIIT
jgi:ATP-dependent RNA helicase DDX49/DBP8